MRITPLPIYGAHRIQSHRHEDPRGSFERMFCATTLAAHGLDPELRQLSLSINPVLHTLRGLHFQRSPRAETKIVRCLRGRLFDVIADLRRGSPTRGRWCAVELTPDAGGVYVPKGCAHGFLTLAPDTHVLYAMSVDYDDVLQAGIRWDDPTLAIAWPFAPAIVSIRDAGHPDFDEEATQ